MELPEYWLSRPAFQIQVERIDAHTFETLASCREGMTLGHITSTNQDYTRMISEILPGLIQRGWITAMVVEKTYTRGNP